MTTDVEMNRVAASPAGASAPAEGTASPLPDYEARGLTAETAPAFARDNCAFLLGGQAGAAASPTATPEGGWLASQT